MADIDTTTATAVPADETLATTAATISDETTNDNAPTTTTNSNKRLKTENGSHQQQAQSEDEEAEEEDDEDRPPHFVNFKYLTKEVMKECSIWSDVVPIENKCSVVYWNFDWDKFMEMTKLTDKDVEPIKQRLYSMSCWLKTPFGYSPYMGDGGQIQNNLRTTLGDYVNKEEGKQFEAQCREWDQFLLETALEKQAEWPIKTMFTLKKGKELDLDLLEQKYKPIARASKKPKYPSYIGYKFETQQADKLKDQKEEKTTALVTVWDNQNKDEPQCEKLTEENIVPKKGEDRSNKTIIIDKNDYVQVIWWFQKIFFTDDAFGPTFIVDELIHDTEENLRAQRSGGKRKCRF